MILATTPCAEVPLADPASRADARVFLTLTGPGLPAWRMRVTTTMSGRRRTRGPIWDSRGLDGVYPRSSWFV